MRRQYLALGEPSAAVVLEAVEIKVEVDDLMHLAIAAVASGHVFAGGDGVFSYIQIRIDPIAHEAIRQWVLYLFARHPRRSPRAVWSTQPYPLSERNLARFSVMAADAAMVEVAADAGIPTSPAVCATALKRHAPAEIHAHRYIKPRTADRMTFVLPIDPGA